MEVDDESQSGNESDATSEEENYAVSNLLISV